MRPKALGYCRVSTSKQTKSGVVDSDIGKKDFDGHSIEEQKSKIKAVCTLNDWDLLDILVDPATSARKVGFFKRDIGKQILAALEDNPHIRFLVVKAQDRVFRNAEDALRTVRILKDDYNVSLFLQSENTVINLSDPEQKLLFGIRALIDEYVVLKNNKRTSDVLQDKKDKGLDLGRAPLGLKRDLKTKKLVDDPVTLRMIETACRLKQEDVSISAIARKLCISRQKVYRLLEAKDKLEEERKEQANG